MPPRGPEAALAHLSRYTHRVAISNHCLVRADAGTVAFKWKDYRIKHGDRMRIMRLPTDAFIRRFLIHVLPSGFHRIRHTGFLANSIRRHRIKTIRRLLDAEPATDRAIGGDNRANAEAQDLRRQRPACGGAMTVIETFTRGQTPQSRAPPWEDAA